MNKELLIKFRNTFICVSVAVFCIYAVYCLTQVRDVEKVECGIVRDVSTNSQGDVFMCIKDIGTFAVEGNLATKRKGDRVCIRYMDREGDSVMASAGVVVLVVTALLIIIFIFAYLLDS